VISGGWLGHDEAVASYPVGPGAPGAPGPRGRRARRAAAHAAALSVAGDASSALLAVQTAASRAQVQVDFAALEGGREAQDLRQRLAQAQALAAQAEDLLARARYELPVLEETPTPELERAIGAYQQVGQQLRAADAALRDVAQRCERPAARVEARLAAVRAPLAPARQQLDEAETRRAAAAAAGLVDGRVDELLGQARTAYDQARAAAVTLPGAAEVARLAGVVTGDAHGLVGRLELLRSLPEEVPHRLTAGRTRLEVVEGRLPATESALSQLRRRYAAAAFADVEGADRSAPALVQQAGDRLAQARHVLARPPVDHEAALELIEQARADLARADAAARGPIDRLRALDEISADPATALAAARHRLREAQRFLLQQQGSTPDARMVQRLDTLAQRLDRAQGSLGAPHPDWWVFLSTLNAVSADASRVISEVRAASAHR